MLISKKTYCGALGCKASMQRSDNLDKMEAYYFCHGCGRKVTICLVTGAIGENKGELAIVKLGIDAWSL